MGYGEVLQVLGKLREAIRAYQQALVVDPNSVEALVGMSSSYLGLDMASNAIAPAEQAVVLSPDDGRARAGTLGKTSDASEAVALRAAREEEKS